MEQKELLEALKYMRDSSPERKFTQSVEFGMNFKGVDFKKASNRVSVDVTLPHGTGKASAAKVLVFVKDRNFSEQLKEKDIPFMMEADVAKLGKKDAEKLANEYDGFLAEGAVMLSVAKYLGQTLAPKRKMPKPIGANISEYAKFVSSMASSVKVSNNKGKFMPVVQLLIGNEKNKDEELADNALAVYNAVMPVLEKKQHSVKNAFVKLTMGPCVKIGAMYRKIDAVQAAKKAADAKVAEAKKAEAAAQKAAAPAKAEGAKAKKEKAPKAKKEAKESTEGGDAQ